MVTVPQENTIAFNEPIPILPPLRPQPLHLSTCIHTVEALTHTLGTWAGTSPILAQSLGRSSLNSVHLAPEKAHITSPTNGGPLIFLRNTPDHIYRSHFTVILRHDCVNLRDPGVQNIYIKNSTWDQTVNPTPVTMQPKSHLPPFHRG